MATIQSRLVLPPIVATPLTIASRNRFEVTLAYNPRRYSASRDVAYDPANPLTAATRASSVNEEFSAAVRRCSRARGSPELAMLSTARRASHDSVDPVVIDTSASRLDADSRRDNELNA